MSGTSRNDGKNRSGNGALTAVQVGLLTIYDMLKAVDRRHGDDRHSPAGKKWWAIRSLDIGKIKLSP